MPFCSVSLMASPRLFCQVVSKDSNHLGAQQVAKSETPAHCTTVNVVHALLAIPVHIFRVHWFMSNPIWNVISDKGSEGWLIIIIIIIIIPIEEVVVIRKIKGVLFRKWHLMHWLLQQGSKGWFNLSVLGVNMKEAMLQRLPSTRTLKAVPQHHVLHKVCSMLVELGEIQLAIMLKSVKGISHGTLIVWTFATIQPQTEFPAHFLAIMSSSWKIAMIQEAFLRIQSLG